MSANVKDVTFFLRTMEKFTLPTADYASGWRWQQPSEVLPGLLRFKLKRIELIRSTYSVISYTELTYLFLEFGHHVFVVFLLNKYPLDSQAILARVLEHASHDHVQGS
mmetsp:Transcript_45357/g.176197  ORF Transcript_45357/g.176197 Transcript_45357/m.176197 type:complete len:108 (-) Transcript_45357:1367-1690(-)